MFGLVYLSVFQATVSRQRVRKKETMREVGTGEEEKTEEEVEEDNQKMKRWRMKRKKRKSNIEHLISCN